MDISLLVVLLAALSIREHLVGERYLSESLRGRISRVNIRMISSCQYSVRTSDLLASSR